MDEVVRKKCTRREINKYEKRMGEWASKIKHWTERRIDGKKLANTHKKEASMSVGQADRRNGGKERKEGWKKRREGRKGVSTEGRSE